MSDTPERRPRAAKPRGRTIKSTLGTPKLVETKGHRWSEEAEAIFLDSLATSCNIRLSANECGFTPEAVHYRRRRDPAFAAKWQAALAQGFAALEAELLRTALDTLTGVEFDASRPLPKMTIWEAMNLYRIHAASVGRGGHRWGRHAPLRSMDELRAGIVRKVNAVRRAQGLPEHELPAIEAAATVTFGAAG